MISMLESHAIFALDFKKIVVKRIKLAIAPLTVLLVFFTSCSTSSIIEEEALFVANEASEIEMQVLHLVNKYRLSKNLTPLEFNAIAYSHAATHTNTMIEDGEITHKDFDKRASNLAMEADASHVAENLGRRYVSAEAVVEAWSKSPTHKKVMEGDYIFTAVSIKSDDEGTLYFTQLFFR